MIGNANLLSSEELNALTTAITDGSIPVDTGINLKAKVRKHDLTNEDSSLGVNVTSLDMINERCIRLFRLSLLEVLRTSPKINPERVRLVKFGDYMKDLHPPLSVNVVRMNPLRGNAMVLIDPNMVFSSLDNFFGGDGKSVRPVAPGRLFTQTEMRVIDLMLSIFFKSLKEAWAPLLSLDFEIVSSEINPHFAQITDENDLVVVNHFDAEYGNMKGFLDVVYPYSALKPIRELLKNRVAAVDGDEESETRWSNGLADAVGDANLEISVLIGQVKSTLNELAAIKINDVIFFNKFERALVNIKGISIFEANVGTAGNKAAINIEKVIEMNPDYSGKTL